jgi:hypothetical protein
VVESILYSTVPFNSNAFGYACPTAETGVASVSTFFRERPCPSNSKWRLANQLVNDYFLAKLGGCKIMSSEDVCKFLNRSSSPGFPWNLVWHEKKELIELDVFWQYFTTYFNSLSTERPYQSFWAVSQKYEVRSSEKLNSNPPKIRTFTGSSMEHTIAMNQFCLDFNNKFYELGSKFKIPSFVGGTKYFRGFDRIMRRLKCHKRGFALDASKYDQSQSANLMWENFKLRLNCLENYSEKDEKTFKELYNQAINSYLVMENGLVFRKDGGMPSGFANTIVDNTISLLRLLVYSFLCVSPKSDLNEISYDIFLLIVMFLNGDDSLISAPEEILEYWNPSTIMPIIERDHGVVFTCPDGVIDVEKLDFLSQTFQYDELYNIYLPRLNKDKAITNLLYDKDTPHPLYTLLKLNAVRTETFPIEELRGPIRSMISLWHRNFVNPEDTCILGDAIISYKQAMSTFLSDDDLWYLYTGFESGRSVTNVDQIKEILSVLNKIFY